MTDSQSTSAASSHDMHSTGIPPDPGKLGPAFLAFAQIIARLRAPDGCPWDRVQTLASIKPYTLEETYELLAAIDSDDNTAICEELGDVLLQVVLDAQIAADEGRFTLIDVIEGIAEKMVRRHPHVFADAHAETPGDVISHWERAKNNEKERDSIFSGLPKALPALARAARVTHKAARVGYDFPQREMLFDKLNEELQELARELFADGRIPHAPAGVEAEVVADQPIKDPAQLRRIEDELGDVLFVLSNIARRWGVNPEEALRRSTEKFESRVRYIEASLAKEGREMKQATLQEMENLYQQGKKQVRPS
ncbi:MAG: nucleoside triphosphate pyrophosphohydrolase [Planctomycetota bacterium]|nr:nucleoside triphosphate pyrophosphohydrolase [Planctomycetota bacterium]MDA1210880.1 nucleoside triphosphate pyrophosphohydrolase [Planctomycetota bacterium]